MPALVEFIHSYGNTVTKYRPCADANNKQLTTYIIRDSKGYLWDGKGFLFTDFCLSAG